VSNREVEIDNQTYNGNVFIYFTNTSNDDDGELYILEENGVNGLHKNFEKHDIDVIDDPNGEVYDFDCYKE
jgi:hypothetical protein